MTEHETKTFADKLTGARLAVCICGWKYKAKMHPDGLKEGCISARAAQKIYAHRDAATNERDRAVKEHMEAL